MRKIYSGILLCALVGFASVAVHAQRQVVLGTEDDVTGFVGAIATSSPPLLVASDGEAAFDPFGTGIDTSDGIQLNSAWVFLGDPGWIPSPSDPNTWILPANLTSIGCGQENETTCEPVGRWLFPGAFWNPGTPEFQTILDSSGNLSDFIRVYNDARGANIAFHSVGVPEPGTLMFLGTGLLAVAGRLLRRRRV